MSTLDHLVYMANQIARNFGTLDEDAAAAEVADHIASFWDPHMKTRIFAHLDAGGADLSPVAAKALGALRAKAAA